LFEIKDKTFIDKCRHEYKLKYAQDSKTRKKMTTPLICGTIVEDDWQGLKLNDKKSITNMTFNRKLRMIRADVFALLSLSTDSNFFNEGSH